MTPNISAAQIVLLAVHLTTDGDIETLTILASRHSGILRKDLLLRILLTYLPEAVPSAEYLPLVQANETRDIPDRLSVDLDYSPVAHLSQEQAAKKVRKLHLIPLYWDGAPEEIADDLTALFLLRRVVKVDEEAGLLDELPGLLVPFLDLAPCIRTLMVSAILPLLRRNCEYYPQEPIPQTLSEFQNLPDKLAVEQLLSQTGVREEDLGLVGRDLKGLIGPWIHNEKRWRTRRSGGAQPAKPDATSNLSEASLCPGWEQVLEWLTTQATKSWKVAVSAIDQWDGPNDVDLGGYGVIWLSEQEQEHLELTYARAALASAYLISEASTEALEGAFGIVTKIAGLLDHDQSPSLQTAVGLLPPISGESVAALMTARNATYLRNELLGDGNVLTAADGAAIKLAEGVIISAFILTQAGLPCTVRRAGELSLLQDEREQKAEALKLIRSMSNNGPKNDDKYWIRARHEILWLRDWGSEEEGSSAEYPIRGVFGKLTREFLEVEILKALLANTRSSFRPLFDNENYADSTTRLFPCSFYIRGL
jgi:hypothetical protein